MLIYVDPQSYSNHYIKECALDKLPPTCKLTSDLNNLDKIDIYVAGFGQVTKEMIEKAKNLKVIIRNAVGTDNIDKESAKKHNIPVYNLPLVNYESVAELVIACMLACGRYIVFNHVANVNNQQHDYYRQYQGIELFHKTVGILGFGHIGKRVAEIVKAAFGCDVLVYDPFIDASIAEKYGVTLLDDYKEIFKKADFITIHTPLTESTKNMVDAKCLALCKPNCILINAARSGIVNEDDLYEALKNHTIHSSACDVLDKEEGNKLFTLDNFIGTSHVGGNSQEARKRVGEHLYEKLMEEIKKIEG